jgi:uncharacterized membrane protein
MIQLNDSITISRSPGDVFAFLADLNNIPKWQAEVVTSKVITTGPTKVGTRFTEKVKMGPMRATANCEVTEFSPDRMMAFKAISPLINYEGRILVDPWEKGARLTLAGTVEPKGLWRLLQPIMMGEFKSGIKKELAAIKEILRRSNSRGGLRCTLTGKYQAMWQSVWS